MSLYFDTLCKAMSRLAEHPKSIFVGQAVRYPGTAMHNTLKDVPMEKRVEFPVAEDMQMGVCTGLALQGFLPICLYPRINFMLLATSQLVLHLDKLPLYSAGGYKPKVIVRTAIAHDKPLDPQPQHLGNFVEAYRSMLKTVQVVELLTSANIMTHYEEALQREGSTLLVEHLEFYGDT